MWSCIPGLVVPDVSKERSVSILKGWEGFHSCWNPSLYLWKRRRFPSKRREHESEEPGIQHTAVTTSTSTLPLKVPYAFATSQFILHVLSASFCNIRQTGYPKCSSPLISSVAPGRVSKWGTTVPCRPLLANKPTLRRCISSQLRVSNARPAARAHTPVHLIRLSGWSSSNQSAEIFWDTEYFS